MKNCSKCKEDKAIKDFYKSKQRKSGVDIYCKQCRKSIAAKNESRQETKDMRSKYEIANKEKRQARFLVRAAIKKGLLVKRPCEDCGKAEVDAHHDDYDNPLNVRWLCREHHNLFHRLAKSNALATPPNLRG